MGAALSLDPTPQIRYALTHRPTAGPTASPTAEPSANATDQCVDIVLDLFRSGERTLTRRIASVRPHELAPVVLACRRYLDRRGARPLRDGAPLIAPAAETDPAPVAAFDWLFAV